jgi:hypothetical protein
LARHCFCQTESERLWKESSKHRNPNDWILASPQAAVRAAIRKVIGWRTFRHTYSTLPIANGDNVKAVQELMRHASSRFTLEVYTQARIQAKRPAQQQLGADNVLRRVRCIGSGDPGPFQDRNSVIATCPWGDLVWMGFFHRTQVWA